MKHKTYTETDSLVDTTYVIISRVCILCHAHVSFEKMLRIRWHQHAYVHEWITKYACRDCIETKDNVKVEYKEIFKK